MDKSCRKSVRQSGITTVFHDILAKVRVLKWQSKFEHLKVRASVAIFEREAQPFHRGTLGDFALRVLHVGE